MIDGSSDDPILADLENDERFYYLNRGSFGDVDIIANPNPKWNATLYNDFEVKNFNFGFMLSYRRKGDILEYSNFSFGIVDGSSLV